MTVNELINYLTHYSDHGWHKADVVICDHRDNPLTSAVSIRDALFIESKDGDSYIVLQTE